MLQKQVTWSILGNTSFQSGLGIDREIKESILLELRDNQVKKKRRHTPGSRNSICKGPAAPRSRHRHNQGGGSRGQGSRRQQRMRSRTHPVRVDRSRAEFRVYPKGSRRPAKGPHLGKQVSRI